jgi:hypothetical protein
VGERIANNVGKTRTVARYEEIKRRLNNAEARYRALVENIPAVTYVDAADKVSSALYMSPQIKTLLGYSPRSSSPTPNSS